MVRAALKYSSRGAALVLAMLIAAFAAVVAVAVAAEQQRWFGDVANRRDQVQAQALALAGVQWARQILQDDARTGTLDHLGEAWAYPLPRTPLENGSIEGSIDDAQGRLNIVNVAKVDALGKEVAMKASASRGPVTILLADASTEYGQSVRNWLAPHVEIRNVDAADLAAQVVGVLLRTVR